MTDLARMTATDLVAAYRDGSASPVEATGRRWPRSTPHNPTVNAFVLSTRTARWPPRPRPKRAGAPATPLGPGDGVPTSIKDLLLHPRLADAARQPR